MTWNKVCGIEEIAIGAMKPFSIDGVSFIVINGATGFVAIPPSCPHMDNALIDGFFDGETLTCDKHLWQWSIPSCEPLGESECRLFNYETQIRNNDIWINLNKNLLYSHEE